MVLFSVVVAAEIWFPSSAWEPTSRSSASQSGKQSFQARRSQAELGSELSDTLGARQPRQLHHRADFDRAFARSWNFRGDPDRFVQILGVDQKIAAEVLARLGERAVRHQPLSLAHANARGRRHRL